MLYKSHIRGTHSFSKELARPGRLAMTGVMRAVGYFQSIIDMASLKSKHSLHDA
jgi:hypothetical protein